MAAKLESPAPDPTPIYNGVADTKEWNCGGFRFEQAPDYQLQIERLPALATNSQPRREGEHVITFRATPLREIKKSMWFEDATSLEDVLALWSFCGAVEVVSPVSKIRRPSAGELSYALVGSDEIDRFVADAYDSLRKRPIDHRTKSALLTYLEIQHVRPLQLDATLICSVLECLAPIGVPSGDNQRYQPVVDLLSNLPVVQGRATRDQIEQVVVFLFGFRNAFLHSGVYPYREHVKISDVVTTTGRTIRTARIFAKFAVAGALKFDPIPPGVLGEQLRAFFKGGSFIPPEIAALFKDQAGA